jgi:Cu/Ag efflux protein CusF/cytochrome c553
MNRNFFKITLTILSAALFFACQNNQTNSNSAVIADKQIYKSVGVVKAIDADAGKITIDHEDIAGYMSAMQMNEAVSDAKMLEELKVGDKVEFEIERTGSKILITKLTKIGEVAVINGSEIYKTNCSTCHGGLGEGTTKGISLLKGHALKHSEDEYIKQVTNGEGKKMPAFKDKLQADQIAALVKFVREDLQKDISEEERTPRQH